MRVGKGLQSSLSQTWCGPSPWRIRPRSCACLQFCAWVCMCVWIHIMCVSIRTMDASDSDGVSEDEGLFQNPPAHVRGSLRSLHADLIALAGPHPSHAPVGVAAKTLGAKAGCMGAAAKSLLVQRTRRREPQPRRSVPKRAPPRKASWFSGRAPCSRRRGGALAQGAGRRGGPAAVVARAESKAARAIRPQLARL